jgi:ethylbenzene hydroxylase subunit gamma/complex iron-sulfur molybdoenzyme family reductase subunit gamma
MLVQRVDAKSEELLDPAGAVWRRTRASNVVLSPTPVEMQPTEYVRVSWKGRPYGTVPSMRVSALHNGRDIFFRLVWADDSADGKIADINEFVDAAAVLFPVAADAPLIGMGIKGKPVNAWFWRADWERPQNVAAEGMGTTQRREDPALASKARHTRGRWDVVLSRSLDGKGAPAGTIVLAPGATSKVAFAVWQGANQERAGVKAFSLDWQELQIEA